MLAACLLHVGPANIALLIVAFISADSSDKNLLVKILLQANAAPLGCVVGALSYEAELSQRILHMRILSRQAGGTVRFLLWTVQCAAGSPSKVFIIALLGTGSVTESAP